MPKQPNLNVLGIIPARGGSKGIERKNLAPCAGKPLLAWTAEAALAAPLARLVLSTDDDEIADVGRSLGLDVPFMRPAKFATDEASTLSVVQHALRHVLGDFGAVLVLQPTNPLRTAADIEHAIALLTPGWDSVRSLVETPPHYNPFRQSWMDHKGRLHSFGPAESEWLRRQNLPPFFVRDGAIYLSRVEWPLLRNRLEGAAVRPYLIAPQRAISIDNLDDLRAAELALHELAKSRTRDSASRRRSPRKRGARRKRDN